MNTTPAVLYLAEIE
jgi:uncharacterized protein YeaO (DUF488 family)